MSDVPLPSAIPATDLRRRALRLAPAFHQAATRVVAAGRFLRGPEVTTLEDEVASWSGRRHAVAVSSGAAAVQLALAALDVGAGDEVIVPAYGPVALATAPVARGAVPVFADVDLATATVHAEALAAARTDATRAIVVHHTYGASAGLADLGLPVVDDVTHAPAAARSSAAAVVVLSCHPSAALGGAADGGLLLTDDDAVADRLRRLRDHGRTDLGVHVEVSQDFRLSELAAAWLRVALRVLEPDAARRRAIAIRLRTRAPQHPWQVAGEGHDHTLAVIRAADRLAFQEALDARGVATSSAWWPLALPGQPALRSYARGEYPHAEAWAAGATIVPCFPDLTDDEVAIVTTALAALEG